MDLESYIEIFENNNLEILNTIIGKVSPWVLLMPAVTNENIFIIEHLINNNIDINSQDPHGWTPIMEAVDGHLEIVKLLLERGANVNEKDIFCFTPLFCASINNHLEIVKVLLEYGANVNEKNKWGITSLHSVSLFGNLEIVKILKNHSKKELENYINNLIF